MSLRLTYPNLAADPMVRQSVEDKILKHFSDVRSNRVTFDNKNKRLYRIWNCELDEYSYSGRSKIFLPAARSAAETWVSAICRDLFPIDDWFRVTQVDDVSTNTQSDALTELLRYFWINQQNLKTASLPGIRQLVMYGTAPFKLLWADREQLIKGLVKNWNPKSGKWKLELEEKVVKLLYGPKIKVVDLFNWFIYPETVSNVKDAQLVFEDIETTIGHIRDMSKKPMDPEHPEYGNVYECDEAVFTDQKQLNRDYDITQSRRERLQRLGITHDPSDKWSDLVANNRNVTECYWNEDLDDEGEKPWLVTVVNDRYAVRIQENPFFKKTSNYLVPRLISCVNEFYGRGILELVDRIQYMFNDITNQTLDSVQYEVNPITIIDPAKVSFTNSIKRAPGAHWLGDPTGFVPLQAQSVSQIGMQTLQILQGFIHDFSANAALQGQPAVRGRGRVQSTATGVQSMLAQGSVPIQEIVEALCHDYAEPVLSMSYDFIEQFMEEPVILRILGKKAGRIIQRKVELEDIVGNYEFQWLGAVSSRNRMILGQQMINFANIARGFPPQVLQQMNWQWLAKKIWSEGMGLRDAEEMFSPQGSSFSIHPKLELELIKENRPVSVSPGDDDMEHLKAHMLDLGTLTKADHIDRMVEHIRETQMTIKSKVDAQKAQEQQQKIQQMMMMAEAAKKMGLDKGNEQSTPNGAKPQTQPSGGGFDGLADVARQIQGGVQ